eukprot:COSAG01_NODE_13670_length_1546_cov_60.773260_1_plen_178_part_00
MLRCGRAGVNLGAPLLPKPFGRQPTSPASHRSGARWTCPSRGRSGRCYDGHSQQRPHGSSMHACMHACMQPPPPPSGASGAATTATAPGSIAQALIEWRAAGCFDGRRVDRDCWHGKVKIIWCVDQVKQIDNCTDVHHLPHHEGLVSHDPGAILGAQDTLCGPEIQPKIDYCSPLWY